MAAGNPPFNLFMPITRALSQLDDRAFIGVLIRSVAWSVVFFAALHVAAIWLIHRLLTLHGILEWAADIVGTIGASLLAFWLFLPVAAIVGTLYFDRIARAVERRYYPWLPPPQGASTAEQMWDGIVVGSKVFVLNLVALPLIFIPGIGWILGWLIGAYAIGRGLFVAVAMRRMPRRLADSLYRSNRSMVIAQGALLAVAAYIPMINLLIPIIGTAAMVHAVDVAISESERNLRRPAFDA